MTKPLVNWLMSDASSRILFRYASVGAVSAIVELSLFQGLHTLADAPVMVANVLAIIGVVVFGFVGQKLFTFRSRGSTSAQARRYLLLVVSSFALNNALVYLFAVVWGWPTVVAKFVQLGLNFIFNFTMSRYFVFVSTKSSD